jgi:hypothetical protein
MSTDAVVFFHLYLIEMAEKIFRCLRLVDVCYPTMMVDKAGQFT